MLSQQEIRIIVRRFVAEPWTKGNLSVLDELCAPNYRLGDDATLQNLKDGILQFRKAVPDLKATVGEIIVEGERAAYRWTMHGRHLGEYEGIAPTGKPVRMTGITILHFENGKIAHDEFESSSPSFIEQVLGKETHPV